MSTSLFRQEAIAPRRLRIWGEGAIALPVPLRWFQLHCAYGTCDANRPETIASAPLDLRYSPVCARRARKKRKNLEKFRPRS
jgi:hypothetical protein